MKKKQCKISAKKLSLVIIIVSACVAIFGSLFCVLFGTKLTIQGQVDTIARDYYENYFYANFRSTISGTLEEGMTNYVENGFPEITLGQLLLANGGKYLDMSDSLAEYCNLDQTMVRFFPNEPYSNQDYRVEYKYSCNF